MERENRERARESDGGKDHEWKKVSRKKKTTRSANQRWDFSKEITSFFVGNIPEDCKKREMWNEFKLFGNLVDVYVANRKDNRGNHFAFVRYKRVKDYAKLLSTLNHIKMRGAKLLVDEVRFDRNKNPINPINPPNKNPINHRNPPPANFHKPTYPTWKPSLPPRTDNTHKHKPGVKSFKQALTGDKEAKKPVTEIELKNHETQTYQRWKGRCALVGKAKTLEDLVRFRSRCEELFQDDVGIHYLGGLSVLLESYSGKAMTNILSLFNEGKLDHFSVLKDWEDQDIERQVERLIWIKISGVPTFLWDNETFDEIAKKFGKIANPSEASWEDLNLTSDTVGILTTNMEAINEVIRVKWKSYSYWVKVEESKEYSFNEIPVTITLAGKKEAGNNPEGGSSRDVMMQEEDQPLTRKNQNESPRLNEAAINVAACMASNDEVCMNLNDDACMVTPHENNNNLAADFNFIFNSGPSGKNKKQGPPDHRSGPKTLVIGPNIMDLEEPIRSRKRARKEMDLNISFNNIDTVENVSLLSSSSFCFVPETQVGVSNRKENDADLQNNRNEKQLENDDNSENTENDTIRIAKTLGIEVSGFEGHFLEKELEQLEKMEAASSVCKEIQKDVETRPDPLLPTTNGPTNPLWDRWFEGLQDKSDCRCCIM